MIISRTPLRISLVGGGTDVPAFYERSAVPGAVVSFAINKYVYIAVNEKFDRRFRVSYSVTENVDEIGEIKNDLVRNTMKRFKINRGLEIVSIADVPGGGTGLGSSSAFTVGLVNALDFYLNQNYRPRGILAETAFDVERECHPSIGKQDAYAAAYGGFNYIRFGARGVSVAPMDISGGFFQSHLLLFYTGIQRSSDELLKEQRKGFESRTLDIGIRMAELANGLYQQAVGLNVEKISKLLNENWELKKRLADGITNPQIDEWYTRGLENGALGGKVCGAGGGGFLLFFAPPEAHRKIEQALGLRRVDFEIEEEGSRIVYET